MTLGRVWIPILLVGAAAATWAQGVGMSKADANAVRSAPSHAATAAVMPALAAPLQIMAAAAVLPSAVDKAAIFKSAGFVQRGKIWHSPDCGARDDAAYTPGAVESFADINGDGRPDAVVTESSAMCYGNTGSAFWIVSQQPGGAWKLMTNDIGIATFLKTKGVGGWPDLEVGGPGFCFPVLRWNGREYAPNRREYEGKPCRN